MVGPDEPDSIPRAQERRRIRYNMNDKERLGDMMAKGKEGLRERELEA
jgi:hypothetical protein